MDKLYDLCSLHLLPPPPSFPASPPFDHLLYHPHPSYLPHGAVVAAAVSVVGHFVYAEIAETRAVASADQVNYLGAIDPNRLDYKHYSHVGDAEGRPAAVHDSALKMVTEAWIRG